MFRPGFIRTQYRFQSTLSTQLTLSSKETFLQNLETNPTLSKLWHTKPQTPNPDIINATSTLPILLRTKTNVFDDIQKENPDKKGVLLKVKQFMGYAKSIVHFYKVGIQNVWKNNKDVRDIKRKFYIESVDKSGVVQKRRIKNGDDVIEVLGALETMESVEQTTLKTNEKTTILQLTRKDLQTIIRTEQDFYKLPLFAIITLIFAEMTPLVCFIFPEIAPSTCVFPALLKKKNSSAIKASKSLTKLRLERYLNIYQSDEVPFQSVHKVPIDELRLLVQSLNLKSRYIPTSLYPISTLRSKLQAHYNKIKVDNYYLINGEYGNNVWGLNKNELIRSCLDRGLLSLEKDDLIHIGSHDLRMRMIFHLAYWNEDKSVGNIGGIGINQLGLDSVYFQNIGHDEAHKLYNWWSHEHKEELK